jgi:serine/threonine protein kinase/Tol biopolymer transport system component
MALTSGTKLGPYEIQSLLGAGGMGEVYRARDTRLDRTVAVKVLASHLSSSPELKHRMEREGRAISSLNHPSICQLYDIGSQNGADYLVMEFLEGETLADKLRKGAMPPNEIYKVGIAVAEALAVAHRSGIVHRDLKPGNIMLTAGGAKLMDFGLAKPLGTPAAPSGSGTAPPSFTAAATMSGPTPLSPLTTAGSIIGTIQYMSPEQIEGKEADARSDIFALGAVLYEMAAGKRPFSGKSQISLASSILESDPASIRELKPNTPPAFEHLVTTCLQKNPEDRYLAAHDIRLELQFIAGEKSSLSATEAAPSPPPASNRRERIAWAAGILAAIVLGILAGIFFHRSAPARVTRTVIDPPEKATLDLTGDSAGPPVLSPDGGMLAFAASAADGKITLWVRPMNSLEPRQLAGTDNAIFPFWSPDGRSLGFFAEGKLKTIDVDGGSPQTVADAPFGRGGAWGPGGVILFSPLTQAGLMRVSANGGTPVPATKIDSIQHTSHRWPFFLPDGKHFLYLAIHHDPGKAANNTLYYASIDGGESKALLHSQSNAVYGSGYLLFARNEQLMAQPFDPSNGTLSGEAQVVAKGVVNDPTTWHMDASAAGELLVLASGGTGDWQLLWMDRGSKQITTVAEKLSNLQMARISPQGDRIAMQIDTGANDIWVLDVARGIKTRLTFGPVSNMFPVWSPDGKWIVYTADRNGRANLIRKPSDGGGAEEILLTDEQLIFPTDWSRDGKYIFYSRGPVGGQEVWALPMEGERKAFLVAPRSANSFSVFGRLSPDGRWLAYSSNESGTNEIYVVPFRGGQGKWQVSANGGAIPHWSRDGKELFYMDASYNLFALPVNQVGGALQFGTAEQLVRNWSAPQVFYDISPDSKRILLDRISQQVSQSVTVVTNFTAGLKK